MGCGVTIANPSSGGVMRSRLVASAKKAKTWPRESGRRIEVISVCIIGGVAFQGAWCRRQCDHRILGHPTWSAQVPGSWNHGEDVSSRVPHVVWQRVDDTHCWQHTPYSCRASTETISVTSATRFSTALVA